MKPINMVAISNDPNSDKKRAVEWKRFIIDKDGKQFLLTTFCHYFEKDLSQTDGYGKQLKFAYERTLIGSNRRFVNPANGQTLIITSTSIANPNFDPLVTNSSPTLQVSSYKQADGTVVINPMGQYDFYELMGKTQPLIVYDFLNSLIISEDLQFQTYDEFYIYA